MNDSLPSPEKISQKLVLPAGIKPYYHDEKSGIAIFLGDCREILPHLDPVDLVLTDPPYGIGKDGQTASTGGHGGRKGYEHLGWDASAPTDDTLRMILEKGRDSIVWGANYFPSVFPTSMGWLVWDKGQRINQSDGELAYTSRGGGAPYQDAQSRRVGARWGTAPNSKTAHPYYLVPLIFPGSEDRA